jgi:hypothetical protein
MFAKLPHQNFNKFEICKKFGQKGQLSLFLTPQVNLDLFGAIHA